jgi:hypothetical protein
MKQQYFYIITSVDFCDYKIEGLYISPVEIENPQAIFNEMKDKEHFEAFMRKKHQWRKVEYQEINYCI